MERGFVLKKTVLVALGLIALVLVAAKLLLPRYVTSPRQAREYKIKQDLLVVRAVIGQYTLDKQQRPHSLDDLVVTGYLRDVPTDPTTGHKDTWVVECSNDLRAPGIAGIDTASVTVASTKTARCD
jgi:general secretion pathway protein G